MNNIGDFHSIGKYSSYAKNSAYIRRRQAEMSESDLTNKTNGSNKTNQSSQSQAAAGLSKGAKSVLEALQTRYGDKMDFYVQNFGSTEEAKGIMSGSTKEFSVLFSPDELEKMASSKSYMNEKLKNIDEAMNLSNRINSEFNMTSKDPNEVTQSDITKIGITFDKNGTMSLFADLEKTTINQKERLEEVREKRAEQQNRYKSKNDRNNNKVSVKRTTVKASSVDELVKKLQNMSWADVEAEEEEVGSSDWWNFEA